MTCIKNDRIKSDSIKNDHITIYRTQLLIKGGGWMQYNNFARYFDIFKMLRSLLNFNHV